ncbi:MAG: carboxypeptidase-like regulatory domain-containing protein [Planctomycetaceae bacterium]
MLSRCRPLAASLAIASVLAISGCYSSSSKNPGGQSTTSTATSSNNAVSAGTSTAAASSVDLSDLTQIPIMTEVDGIEIPRLKSESPASQLDAAIPTDVGNTHAAKNPKDKATGDQVIVRFNAEPKSLNPITENSAYKSYILQRYVNESLALRNMETFEFEPHIAQRWVIEDSVKLSPDYPGRERRIKLAAGEPQPQLEIDYQAPAPVDGPNQPEPPVISATTLDNQGQPVPGVWVGVYPQGKIIGAPATGYHTWSDDKGEVKLSGYPTGKYTVKVGAEVFGKTALIPTGHWSSRRDPTKTRSMKS